MHIFHFLLDFFTITTLASHVVYCTSLMNHTFRSFLASSSTTFPFSGSSFLFLCVTGLAFGQMTSLWQWNLGWIPGISNADHAKRSTFFVNTWANDSFTSSYLASWFGAPTWLFAEWEGLYLFSRLCSRVCLSWINLASPRLLLRVMHATSCTLGSATFFPLAILRLTT